MKLILLMIIAYLIGSINLAYVFGKLKGFDIREVGSKNAGASNTKLMLGWKYFFIVVIFDITKSIIAAMIGKYLFKVGLTWQVIAGCFTVVGHNFPFYLNFKGGKGFASYIGLAFFINWKVFLIIMTISLVVAILVNYIVVSTVTLTFSLPIFAIAKGMDIVLILALIVTSCVILYKHKDNLYRFLTKTEIGINGKPIGINVLNRK